MQCPSCDAEHSPDECQQSLASAPAVSTQEFESDSFDLEDSDMSDSQTEMRPASRLIEFPGVTRRAVPQWRKELSERVREVQERKARETALELAAAAEEASALGIPSQTATTTTQLELLPQVEAREINPVLVAALRRIERAHQAAAGNGNGYSRTATAVALDTNYDSEPAEPGEGMPAREVMTGTEPVHNVERTHNLVVVQPAVGFESKADINNEVQEMTEPEAVSAAQPEAIIDKPRPRRLIADDLNDPALSYLDAIGLSSGPVQQEDRASIPTRFMAGLLDVVTVGFLSLPFAALIELQNGNWQRPQVIALMAGIAAAVMFLYATVCTAMTGRTLGMRLLSLRAVDARNGLIPTGSQSAGRALVYLLSLATLGFGLLMVFARGEGKAVHDRVTRTAVVRD